MKIIGGAGKIFRRLAWRSARNEARIRELEARERMREAQERIREARMEMRRFHTNFLFALLYAAMALVNLVLGAKKRRWVPHITGMLLLFISGLYFFLDFLGRKTEDL